MNSHTGGGDGRVVDAIPVYSALTAFTELIVTVAIFYVAHRALVEDELEMRVLGAAVAYEILFNVTYMTARLFSHGHTGSHPDWMVTLLAGHGALSFVMLLGLIAFGLLAWRGARGDRNLLREQAGSIYAFLGLWTISILSGEAVFVLEYVGHY
jgi:hypothetical protein